MHTAVVEVHSDVFIPHRPGPLLWLLQSFPVRVKVSYALKAKDPSYSSIETMPILHGTQCCTFNSEQQFVKWIFFHKLCWVIVTHKSDVLILSHTIDEETEVQRDWVTMQGLKVGAEAIFTPRQGNSRACALNDLTIGLSHGFIQLKYMECLPCAKFHSRWWR